MFKPHFFSLFKSTKYAWMLAFLLLPPVASANWNEAWSASSKISINAQGVSSSVSQVAVPVRLHSGNFDFLTASIDGSDLRFIAADNKTELSYYIEKFDAVNELALVWVKLPVIDPAAKEAHIWVYSGNENATTTSNAQAVLDANVKAAFHFKENALLTDDSATALQASGGIASQSAGLLGSSALLNGQALTISSNPAIDLSATGAYTWSGWIKPSTLPQEATLFSQGEVSLKIAGQQLKLDVAGTELAGGEVKPAWQHIAFTFQAGKAIVYLNGTAVANGDVQFTDAGGDVQIGEGLVGEIDELIIANTARNETWIKLAAASQGVDSKLLSISLNAEGEEGEGEGEVNYLGILIDSLTVDAKVVIAILAVMFLISAWVMVQKAMLVTRTDADNKRFLARFQKADKSDLLTLGKGADYPHSNLFLLYQAGLREIVKRKHPEQTLELSGASMDAIKAAIDADLVRETQRQNAGMVLLTIAISGGPFLGLLGTVVGVMITFAAIAAAGEVNVNAIAPGIAAALLATVAGLGVAIPALFGYNYLASRIKTITIAMQIFVDEFVTRSAELFGKE
jgi:biopolymer transport protein ExbB